ncbi:MAG: sensor histidine kinase [Armatimonadota bacterium]
MRRPWYQYPLLFVGILLLLGALFGPTIGVTSVPPGGVVSGEERVLQVADGSPLARAGARTGDRWVKSEVIAPAAAPAGERSPLGWKNGIPRSGEVELRRNGAGVWLQVQPVPPAWPVRLAWGAAGLLNVALIALGLALIWQRPGDGRALLLGLVLMVAPVFGFPREPRLFALVLLAHFFTIFPDPEAEGRRAPGRWRIFFRLYLPFGFFGLIGSGMWDEGRIDAAAALFDTMALGYALYGLGQVLLRWRRAAPEARPVIRTLTVAAGATVAAVIAGIFQRLWVISDQFVPVNLLPALLFSGAMAHLVFRLRALEVRLVARHTLRYLLARWTLGTLFLIPGFVLVWRMGQLSVTHQPVRPGEVVFYLFWMFLVALLLAKRMEVLRNVDRRFFRDVEARRQALIRLAQDLGGEREAAGVMQRLEAGVRQALRPEWLTFALPDLPAADGALPIPVRRGEAVLGYLRLGPKESGEAYSPEERELLEAAAVQAAVALENARLNGELLARQRVELAARTSGVLSGAEEERRRLAADLHDQVLPGLRQMAADVERLRERSNGQAPDLARLEGEIRESMDSVREVMEALRPSALDMLGLSAALESYLRRGAARQEPPLTVSVRRTGEEPELSPEQSLGLFRICQEAINNVLKHSGARKAGLEVRSEPGRLTLCLWDDGRGFDPETARGAGRGLENMRYRADLIDARVTWSPREEGGTRVEVTVLMQSRSEPEQV